MDKIDENATGLSEVSESSNQLDIEHFINMRRMLGYIFISEIQKIA